MKNVIVILLVLLSTTMSSAQKVFSLDDCIQLSLKNNLQLKNSELDRKKVESQISEAKSGFLPSVDLNGQYQYYLKMPKMLVPADFMPGGTPGQYIEMSLGSPQTTGANLQVSQVLYNQKVFIGLKAAQTAKDLTYYQIRKTREDLIYNVSAVYYNLQVLQQNLCMLDSNILTLEKIQTANNVLAKNEIMSKTAYNRIQIGYENLKNERQNLALMNQKSYHLLKFLVGLPMNDSVQVSAFSPKDYKLESGLANIEQRNDLRLMNEQVRLAEIDKKASIASFYPSLAGVYNFGVTGYNDKVDPFRAMQGNWMKSSYIGLQLNIPIFSGFSRTQKVKQKDLELQKARNSYDLMKQSAQKEVADAINNYMSTSNSFENTKRSLQLASEIFRNADTEYKSGLLSLSDLLQIQSDLTTARNNYSNAMINLRLAEIELRKAKGELEK